MPELGLHPESSLLFAQRNEIPCPKGWHSGLPLSEGIKEVMAQWWLLPRLILIQFGVTQTHVHIMLRDADVSLTVLLNFPQAFGSY